MRPDLRAVTAEPVPAITTTPSPSRKHVANAESRSLPTEIFAPGQISLASARSLPQPSNSVDFVEAHQSNSKPDSVVDSVRRLGVHDFFSLIAFACERAVVDVSERGQDRAFRRIFGGRNVAARRAETERRFELAS